MLCGEGCAEFQFIVCGDTGVELLDILWEIHVWCFRLLCVGKVVQSCKELSVGRQVWRR